MPLGVSALLIWVLAVAYQDLRQRQIANALTYPCLILSAASLVLSGESLSGDSGANALLGLGIALLLGLPGQGSVGRRPQGARLHHYPSLVT